ncbi:MAG: hypothetical protein KJ709_01100 [Nanoarchaeota archaeon]|nr:hypothetical protein [Nanoarchaeota archaeon]
MKFMILLFLFLITVGSAFADINTNQDFYLVDKPVEISGNFDFQGDISDFNAYVEVKRAKVVEGSETLYNDLLETHNLDSSICQPNGNDYLCSFSFIFEETDKRAFHQVELVYFDGSQQQSEIVYFGTIFYPGYYFHDLNPEEGEYPRSLPLDVTLNQDICMAYYFELPGDPYEAGFEPIYIEDVDASDIVQKPGGAEATLAECVIDTFEPYVPSFNIDGSCLSGQLAVDENGIPYQYCYFFRMVNGDDVEQIGDYVVMQNIAIPDVDITLTDELGFTADNIFDFISTTSDKDAYLIGENIITTMTVSLPTYLDTNTFDLRNSVMHEYGGGADYHDSNLDCEIAGDRKVCIHTRILDNTICNEFGEYAAVPMVWYDDGDLRYSIRKHYPYVPVKYFTMTDMVNPIDFDLNQGEYVAIPGTNKYLKRIGADNFIVSSTPFRSSGEGGSPLVMKRILSTQAGYKSLNPQNNSEENQNSATLLVIISFILIAGLVSYVFIMRLSSKI